MLTRAMSVRPACRHCPIPIRPGICGWHDVCDYIRKLVDPNILQIDKRRIPLLFQTRNSCRGFGRYFFEYWVHSHPHVKPCDLYTNRNYVWGYYGVPNQNDWFDDDDKNQKTQKQIQLAPRFGFDDYVMERVCNNTRKNSVEERIYNYKYLYPSLFVNVSTSLATLNKSSWWGWEFFK